MPSRPAASATPCAWLPALAATTPRARSSADSREIRTYAPRTLYEPARCRFSHLSHVGPPSAALSGREGSSGVVPDDAGEQLPRGPHVGETDQFRHAPIVPPRRGPAAGDTARDA